MWPHTVCNIYRGQTKEQPAAKSPQLCDESYIHTSTEALQIVSQMSLNALEVTFRNIFKYHWLPGIFRMSRVRNFLNPDYEPYRWQLIPHYGRGGRGRMVLIRIRRLTLPHQLHLLTKLEVAKYRIGTGAPLTIGNHALLINSDPVGPCLPSCFRPQFAYRQIRAYVDHRTPKLSIQQTPCVFNECASPWAGGVSSKLDEPPMWKPSLRGWSEVSESSLRRYTQY